MAPRIMGGAIARLATLTLLGVALAVVGFAAPAAADVTSPPGPNTPPAAPGWIAFQLSSTNLTVGSTVQVSVAGGSTIGAAQFFSGGPDWPTSWSGGGLSLQYQGNTPCDFATHASSSCAYTVTGNAGTFDNVLFGAGSIPPDQVNALEQTITVTTPTTQPTTPPTPPQATFSGPPNGLLTGPGQFTFNAPGQFGVTYTWTLLFNGQQVDKQSGASYTPPSSIFTTPGQYTLTLTASNSAYPNGVTSQPVQFEIPAPSNPNPTPSPSPTPGPSPAPAAPTPAASPPAFTHLSTVSYVPLSNFDVPTPAAIRPVTVIWLWRPDWFQTAEAARTAGRPSAAKRATVSVDAKGTAGPSATPWLAGLATFGIFGFVWILVRRRRVRTSILD